MEVKNMIYETDEIDIAKEKAMKIITKKADKKGIVELLRVGDFFVGVEDNEKNKSMFRIIISKLQEEGFIESIHYSNKNKLIVDKLVIDSAWFETILNVIEEEENGNTNIR